MLVVLHLQVHALKVQGPLIMTLATCSCHSGTVITGPKLEQNSKQCESQSS